MKDIPVFTTEYGVASLVLKEVPYKALAFVRVRSVEPGRLREHLAECVSFCRMVGAERVLAAGDEDLAAYPLHSVVYTMSRENPREEPPASLWPVTDRTVGQWRDMYNKGMGAFDNHATMTSMDEKMILSSGGAYFVHREGRLLGLGWMEGEQLLAVVSGEPGMGETVARTLFTVTDSDRITLEVVSENTRAIRLYERMGFLRTGERERWYRIF